MTARIIDGDPGIGCEACIALPTVSECAGTLLLAPALTHTRIDLIPRLRAIGATCSRHSNRIVTIEVPVAGLADALEQCDTVLSTTEQRNCRVLFLEQGRTFDLDSLADMQPLSVLVANARGRWLRRMIADDRLVTHFQPIVHADDSNRLFAYECLLRGLDEQDALVQPADLFSAARSAELMFHLDRAARLAAIRHGMEHDIQVPLFINFNPSAIYDPTFCLRATSEAALASTRSPADFVFEVVESDRASDERHLRRILDHYRSQGFRIALDDLGAGYGSLNLLANIRPDFVKLDINLVRGIDHDSVRQTILARLLDMARDLDIRTIAEGVETLAEWHWLETCGIDYAQGFLFSPPAAPPPSPVVSVEA